MKLKKLALTIFAVLIVLLLLVAYNFYTKIYAPNVTEDTAVYIPTDASFDKVKDALKPYIDNTSSFQWVAEKKNYPNVIKPGKYLIKKGMSNNELIDLLRSGKQTPVMVTFNNQDTLEKLSERLAEQLEPDSLQLLNTFLDTDFLQKNNLSKKSVLGIFIPNTYELYWNASAKKLRDRMLHEYNTFWNKSRINKAKELGLTKQEVITLASIVQKETSRPIERPSVAGLYLNRLRSNWALQADPTIIYALKQKYGEDYEVKRVLNKDLTIASPYNTYIHTGLPPSLIAMPDISSIDAVLNPKNHDYYYMCASVTNIGYHEFARTLAQHNKNAAKYQQWISKQGINR